MYGLKKKKKRASSCEVLSYFKAGKELHISLFKKEERGKI